MNESVIRQLNEITKWIQDVISTSKPIHLLENVVDNNDLYIAVSDGIHTGKTKFKPNEVTKEQFETLREMQLGSDSETNTIFIQDGDGNILTSLNMDLFTRNFVNNSEMEEISIPNWSGQLETGINF